MAPAPHSPLPPSSDAARNVARRLFANEAGGETTDDALVAAAERVCALVSEGISRWFGPYGSLALLTRALTRAQADHPSLVSVTIAAESSWHVMGLGDSAKTHGATATVAGVVAMLAALADLIGRLIGDDLATTLLEQSVAMPLSSETTTTVDATVAAKPAADAKQTGKTHG